MTTVPFSRVMRVNIKTVFRLRNLILTIFIFSLIGLLGVYMLSGPSSYSSNVWDVLFFTFAGPSIQSESFFEFISWFLPFLMFFYLFGNNTEEELSRRGDTIIPLIGSRRKWWLGKVVTLLLISIAYMLIGILIVLLIGVIFFPFSTKLSPILLQYASNGISVISFVGLIFLLYTSTLFALSFVQTVFAVMWRNSFIALIFVAALMVVSWVFGTNRVHIVPWLPGSQAMLLRHTLFEPSVPHFNLSFSLFYNLAIILISFIVGFLYVRRMDIFKETIDIHTGG